MWRLRTATFGQDECLRAVELEAVWAEVLFLDETGRSLLGEHACIGKSSEEQAGKKITDEKAVGT